MLIYWNNNDLFAGGLIVRYAHTRLHKGGIEIEKINLQAVRFVRFVRHSPTRNSRPDDGKSSHCDNGARPKSTLSSWIYSEPRWNCILLSGSRVSVQCAVQRDQALKVSARRIRRKNRANKTSLQVKCSKTICRSVSGLGTPLLPNFDDFLENFQKIMLQILPL